MATQWFTRSVGTGWTGRAVRMTFTRTDWNMRSADMVGVCQIQDTFHHSLGSGHRWVDRPRLGWSVLLPGE